MANIFKEIIIKIGKIKRILKITNVFKSVDLLNFVLLILGNERYYTEQKRIKEYKQLVEEKKRHYFLNKDIREYSDETEFQPTLKRISGLCYSDLTKKDAFDKIIELNSRNERILP